jgi:hypothetical protein
MKSKLLIILIIVCGDSSAEESPLVLLETQLLSSPLTFEFQINSSGAVVSDIKGRFHYCEDELTIDVDGELFAEPVRLKMRADRERLSLNDTSMPMPDHLHEAIIVGFVRMGLLHNIIRLSGNLIPDHGEGGVRDWVDIPVVGQNSDFLFFDIFVSNTKAAHAELKLDDEHLPISRHQTMYFGGDEMLVTENYALMTLSCPL